jgi:hypothetical protein
MQLPDESIQQSRWCENGIADVLKAGFGYSMLNPKLKKYGLERRDHIGEYDEFSGHFADLDQPLVNQPGERFEYGVCRPKVQACYQRMTLINSDQDRR